MLSLESAWKKKTDWSTWESWDGTPTWVSGCRFAMDGQYRLFKRRSDSAWGWKLWITSTATQGGYYKYGWLSKESSPPDSLNPEDVPGAEWC